MQTYTGKVESKEGHDKVSEERSKGASKKSANDGSKAPVNQDAKVNDVPSCAKCGEIFNPPWRQRHHRCPGSAEPSKIVDKPVPAARIHKGVEVSGSSQRTRSSTISKMERTNEAAGEDLPKCEKCGRIFPLDQLCLRWTHKCEPLEVAHTPERRLFQKEVSNVSSDADSDNIEQNLQSESNSASLTCGCGKTFVYNQRREFVMHNLECNYM